MRVLDLFSGACGGWSLGLHRAGGFETVAACEVDQWRRERFARNFPGAKLYDDVRTLTADRLRADGVFPDTIVGSPPCQDASTANAQGRGVDGERTGLIFEAVRIIGECRPDWACLENVPGLRTRGYDRVHDALEAFGYTVRPLVVGAWHAGADHRRNRVWIIANAPGVRRTTGRARGLAASPPREREQALRPDAPEMLWTEIEGDQSNRVAARLRSSVWNGGVAARLGVVDGLPKGLAEKTLGAFGDAVVPIIPELIGRAIMEAA